MNPSIDSLQAKLNDVLANLDPKLGPNATALMRNHLAVLWSEVALAQDLKQARSRDTACMDAIHALLDGQDWPYDHLVLIAEIVIRSGRRITPPPEDT